MRPQLFRNNTWDRRLGLALGAAAITWVWLVALPWLGGRPELREDLRWRAARGINAGAMYYTELEAMPDIAAHLDELHERHAEAFWRVSERSPEPPAERAR